MLSSPSYNLLAAGGNLLLSAKSPKPQGNPRDGAFDLLHLALFLGCFQDKGETPLRRGSFSLSSKAPLGKPQNEWSLFVALFSILFCVLGQWEMSSFFLPPSLPYPSLPKQNPVQEKLSRCNRFFFVLSTAVLHQELEHLHAC